MDSGPFCSTPKPNSPPSLPLALAASHGFSLGGGWGEGCRWAHLCTQETALPGDAPGNIFARQTSLLTAETDLSVIALCSAQSSFYSLGREGWGEENLPHHLIVSKCKAIPWQRDCCSPWTGQNSSWALKVGQEDKGHASKGVVAAAMDVQWWPGGSPVGNVAAIGKVARTHLGGQEG